MSAHRHPGGRPRREYEVRVVPERRADLDYRRLARALLEHLDPSIASSRTQVEEASREPR